MRRPKRCAPKFYVKSRLNFCVSCVLDPIGDRILIGNTNRSPHTRPGRPPIPGRGGLAHAPDRAGPAGPCPAPCAGAVGPPSEGPGGGAPAEALREGPAHGAGHGPAGPARPGAWTSGMAWAWANAIWQGIGPGIGPEIGPGIRKYTYIYIYTPARS